MITDSFASLSLFPCCNTISLMIMKLMLRNAEMEQGKAKGEGKQHGIV